MRQRQQMTSDGGELALAGQAVASWSSRHLGRSAAAIGSAPSRRDMGGTLRLGAPGVGEIDLGGAA